MVVNGAPSCRMHAQGELDMSTSRKHWVAAARTLAALSLILALASVVQSTPAGAMPTDPGLTEPWVEQGPFGVNRAQTIDPEVASPVGGAVEAIVPDPDDASHVWIGAVGGGVWETHDALDDSPHWVPLTDDLPGLSIASLKLDPFDGTHRTLVAGIGNHTVYQGIKTVNPHGGIARTTDGGKHWTWYTSAAFDAEKVWSVVPLGNMILIAGRTGVWRLDIDGSEGTFTLLSDGTHGLPEGSAYEMISAPAHPDRVFAVIGGDDGGIFRTNDDNAHRSGDMWHSLGGWTFGGRSCSKPSGQPCDDIDGDGVDNAVMTMRAGDPNTLYVAVDVDGAMPCRPQNCGQPCVEATPCGGLFYTDTPDVAAPDWIQIPSDLIADPDAGESIHGDTHLSMVADPLEATEFYLGLDKETDEDENGQAFSHGGDILRCDTSNDTCGLITRAETSDGSTTHGDSRYMAMDQNDQLLESDDGGISRQTEPQDEAGNWLSMNGDLRAAETFTCAWDGVVNTTLCGLQDNGNARKPIPSPAGATWDSLQAGDGDHVAVNDPPGSTRSTEYSASNALHAFNIYRCTSAPRACAAPTNPKLRDLSRPGHRIDESLAIPPDENQPMAVHVSPTCSKQQIAISAHGTNTASTGNDRLWESTDGGNTFSPIAGFIGKTRTGGPETWAIGYGAQGCGISAALYAGSTAGLFLRSPNKTFVDQLTTYPGDTPAFLSVDPRNWHNVAVTSIDSHIYWTANAGKSWQEITGDLDSLGGRNERGVAVIPRRLGRSTLIAVGTVDGVYLTETNRFGQWWKLGGLPNAYAVDLQYDRHDDVLTVATMGRGAWTLSGASTMKVPPDLDARFSSTFGELGHDVTVTARLTDGNTGLAIPNETVRFSLGTNDTSSCHSLTNTWRTAQCKVRVKQVEGAMAVVTATFDGDENTGYTHVTDEQPFTVNKESTAIQLFGLDPKQGAEGSEVSFAARLYDPLGNLPISGEPLVFAIGDDTCTATTDSFGLGFCTIALTQTPGPYALVVSFVPARDFNYVASQARAAFLITPPVTDLPP
jgi:hypothetical protein